jgi:hypothetical protein
MKSIVFPLEVGVSSRHVHIVSSPSVLEVSRCGRFMLSLVLDPTIGLE